MGAEKMQVEQTIKKQVTINAGVTDTVELNIPAGIKAYLKGYGYTWYDSNTFKLSTGNLTLPSRTDQEGSASIPRIFDRAFEIRSGGTLKLTITNGDIANHTYDVVFYILSDQLLEGPDFESTGGELLIGTSAGGSGASVTTVTGSVTALENVETSHNTAVGTSKIIPIAVSDGTNYYRARGASNGAILTALMDPSYTNEKQVCDTASVPASSYVDKQITLSGTNRVIKEVYIYLPDGGGDQAKVEIYNGAPTTNKLGEFYYNARSFAILASPTAITGDLYLRIYGESGSAQTAYIDVVYHHD